MKADIKFLRLSAAVGFAFLVIFPLSAKKKYEVAATNSWTAAYAAAAGVKSVVKLAPESMVHPPEYELKPSDAVKIKNADYLVYAGYEVMMKTVFENFRKPEELMIKINTGYNPEIIRKSVTEIAMKCGDMKTAEKSLKEIDGFFYNASSSLLTANLMNAEVIVNFHQKPFAEALGFKVAGIFGPGPLQAKQIKELGKLKPMLIIDNAHNPLGAPLAEITGARRIELVNFPGYRNRSGKNVPETLIGVMKYNLEVILAAAE